MKLGTATKLLFLFLHLQPFFTLIAHHDASSCGRSLARARRSEGSLSLIACVLQNIHFPTKSKKHVRSNAALH